MQILVVDDNESDRRLIELALRRTGVDVRIAEAIDGEDAFVQLDGGLEIDLILLDLNMAGMDGRECLTRLKADRAHATIPVVVFSSSAQPSDRVFCYRAGCAAYMQKPMDFPQMVDRMQRLLDFWSVVVGPGLD